MLEYIPPEAVYHRAPLDDCANALEPWLQAVERFVKPQDEDDLWGDLVRQTAASDAPADVGSPQNRQIVQENGETSDFLHAGIERGRLQFAELHYPETFSDEAELAKQLGEVAWILHLRAAVLAADEELTAAAGELIGLLRMGEMICNGDGQVLHYLIGAWIRRAAIQAIGRLAGQEGISRSALEGLLAAVSDSLDAPDGLASCLRADLCLIALPQLDRTPTDGNLDLFINRFLEAPDRPRLIRLRKQRGGGRDVSPRTQLARRRQRIVALLESHPQPLDKIATARLLGERVADTIRRLHPRPQASWLTWIAPAQRLLRGGPHGAAEADADVFAQLNMIFDEDTPAAREQFQRLTNPVGLVLAERLLPADASQFAFQYQANLHQTKKLLAKRLRRCM